MNEGKRPGGLTALAVINFVLGALAILGILVLIGGSAVLDVVDIPEEDMTAQDRQELEEARQVMKDPAVRALSGLDGLKGLLLVVSGIGYLQQKKLLGRGLGNATALASLALAVATAIMLAGTPGGGFGLLFIIGIVYPVLTLFFLNVTFKEDFTR